MQSRLSLWFFLLLPFFALCDEDNSKATKDNTIHHTPCQSCQVNVTLDQAWNLSAGIHGQAAFDIQASQTIGWRVPNSFLQQIDSYSIRLSDRFGIQWEVEGIPPEINVVEYGVVPPGASQVNETIEGNAEPVELTTENIYRVSIEGLDKDGSSIVEGSTLLLTGTAGLNGTLSYPTTNTPVVYVLVHYLVGDNDIYAYGISENGTYSIDNLPEGKPSYLTFFSDDDDLNAGYYPLETTSNSSIRYYDFSPPSLGSGGALEYNVSLAADGFTYDQFEYNDVISAAASIELGVTYQLSIFGATTNGAESNVDYLAVELQSTENYDIDIAAVQSGLDLFLTIIKPDGETIELSVDDANASTLNPSVSNFGPEETGTYYLRLESYSGIGYYDIVVNQI